MIIRAVRKLTLTLVAFALLATVGVASASAATVTCAPNLIEYYPNTLIVQCTINGLPTNFYGDVTRPGCATTQVLDTLRFWQGLAQAALLAGKNVQIYYTPIGGGCNVNSMSTLDLVK